MDRNELPFLKRDGSGGIVKKAREVSPVEATVAYLARIRAG